MILRNASEDIEKLDHSYITAGNVECYSHSGKQFESLLKKLNMQLLYDPAIALLGIYPREKQIHTKAYTGMFLEALFVIVLKTGSNPDDLGPWNTI